MNHKIFIRACELLKASGSSYEELITPFWSEVQDGVVLPTFGKVIPRLEPERHECPWDDAMADAAAAGLALPSREEEQYMRHHLDQINELLLAHNGNPLPCNKDFWSRTEHRNDKDNAWYVYFGTGYMGSVTKCCDLYVRPLAEFKNVNIF